MPDWGDGGAHAGAAINAQSDGCLGRGAGAFALSAHRFCLLSHVRGHVRAISRFNPHLGLNCPNPVLRHTNSLVSGRGYAAIPVGQMESGFLLHRPRAGAAHGRCCAADIVVFLRFCKLRFAVVGAAGVWQGKAQSGAWSLSR